MLALFFCLFPPTPFFHYNNPKLIFNLYDSPAFSEDTNLWFYVFIVNKNLFLTRRCVTLGVLS